MWRNSGKSVGELGEGSGGSVLEAGVCFGDVAEGGDVGVVVDLNGASEYTD